MRSIKSWVIAVALLHCLAALENRPVRIFHGLGDDCKNFKPPTGYEHISCVETGAGNASMTNKIEEMAEEGCKILTKEIELFKDFGVNFICYSQGGIIARYLLKSCSEVTPYVKKIVFVGTPHLGITELPSAKEFGKKDKTQQDAELEKILRYDYLDGMSNYQQNELIKKIDADVKLVSKPEGETDLTSFFKDIFFNAAKKINEAVGGNTCAPAQYYNKELGQGAIIREISDEKMDDIYANLELVLNILNQDERVIIPKESVTFGVEVIHENSDGSKAVRKKAAFSDFLNNHPDGLGQLFFEGRMINCVSSSSHAMLNKMDLKVILDFFVDDKYNLSQDPIKELKGDQRDKRIKSILKDRDEFIKNYPNFCQRYQAISDEHPEESVPIDKNMLFSEYKEKTRLKMNLPQQTVQEIRVSIPKQNPNFTQSNGSNQVLTSQSSGEVPRILV